MSKKYVKMLNLIETLNLETIILNDKLRRNRLNRLKNAMRHPIKNIMIKCNLFKENFNQKEQKKAMSENNFFINNDTLIKENVPRIIVYTCITGDYDDICEPFLECNNIDFCLFTNNKKLIAKIWNVKSIDTSLINKYDNILLNRYYKFHPFEFFSNKKYDYAIYIDGNIKVMSDLTTLVYAVNNKTGLALHNHCLRDDVYDEAKACCIFHKGNSKKIKEQILKYKKEFFPSNFGLFECNVIVSDLKNKTSKIIMDNWWNDFVSSKSYRDQLSLPYVLWKLGYNKDDIGCLGENVYRNPKFRFNNHK